MIRHRFNVGKNARTEIDCVKYMRKLLHCFDISVAVEPNSLHWTTLMTPFLPCCLFALPYLYLCVHFLFKLRCFS